MKNNFIPTIIIGSGFSGSAVASCLKKSEYLILERGEKLDYFEAARIGHSNELLKEEPWKVAQMSLNSEYKENEIYSLSKKSHSQFVFREGGSSNRWGGRAIRLSSMIFDDKDREIFWPYSSSEMDKMYIEAEKVMNICSENRPDAKIQGGDYYRNKLSNYFGPIVTSPQAKNLTNSVFKNQYTCCGAGSCELCPADAKARAGNIFEISPQNILNKVIVKNIIIENGKAKAVEFYDISSGQSKKIFCNKVVVACHAIESAKIVYNSFKKSKINNDNIGKFFQDHAIAQVVGYVPEKLLYNNTNTHTQFSLPEFSGEIDGVEYETLFLSGPPGGDELTRLINIWANQDKSIIQDYSKLRGFVRFYILFEMPPEMKLKIDFSEEKPELDDKNYWEYVVLYEKIFDSIKSKMTKKGIKILDSYPHYKNGYGTHHLMGTLNMSPNSLGVVNKDFSLKEVDNIYIAGSSLFPRCGSANPTLTIVALALELGRNLSKH